jgi:transcription initiation factor TFIID subunit 4
MKLCIKLVQAESNEKRRQDANKTAFEAIGPRKKRKLEEVPNTASAASRMVIVLNCLPVSRFSVEICCRSVPFNSNKTATLNNYLSFFQMFRPKIKRVSLRDLIFLMEQEKEFRKSALLYKALNK